MLCLIVQNFVRYRFSDKIYTFMPTPGMRKEPHFSTPFLGSPRMSKVEHSNSRSLHTPILLVLRHSMRPYHKAMPCFSLSYTEFDTSRCSSRGPTALETKCLPSTSTLLRRARRRAGQVPQSDLCRILFGIIDVLPIIPVSSRDILPLNCDSTRPGCTTATAI